MRADFPEHGGDRAAAIRRYGAGDWLDLSANINPAGPPPEVMHAVRKALDDPLALQDYPTGRERQLRKTLAERLQVAQTRVVLGNGAAALIDAFLRAYRPRRCLLPQPAFSEYERALHAASCEIVPFHLRPEHDFAIDVEQLTHILDTESIDALIVTNPHNPSGMLTARTQMQAVIAACKRHTVALLIDEAFIDYVPHESVGTITASNTNIFVIRSFTKFFAIPGFRVGYGLASNEALAQRMQYMLPSWPISALALEAASALDSIGDYAERAILHNDANRFKLRRALEQLQFQVFPSFSNFVLCTHAAYSSAIANSLARDFQILVRDCASYRIRGNATYLRIAVRTERDTMRLICALRQLLPPEADYGNARSETVMHERRADEKHIWPA